MCYPCLNDTKQNKWLTLNMSKNLPITKFQKRFNFYVKIRFAFSQRTHQFSSEHVLFDLQKYAFFFLLQISRTQARLQDQRSSVLLERELLSSSKFAWGSIRVREQAWYGFPTDVMSSEDLLGCDRPLVGKSRGNGIPGLEKKSYLHITWECMDPLQFWETFQK